MSKKLKSTLPNMVIVLTSIAVIAGLALGYVNSVTEEPIRLIKQQQLSDGIKAVLAADELTVEATDTLENGSVIYRTDKGVAVQATDPNGFGGKLTILVGFDSEATIQGYRILETAETPGLGAKADQWFQEGQKGNIIGMSPAKNNMTVSKDGGEVDAITASTITSRAFLRAVNMAYEALGKAEVDGESGATIQQKEEKEVTNE